MEIKLTWAHKNDTLSLRLWKEYDTMIIPQHKSALLFLPVEIKTASRYDLSQQR